MGPGETIAVEVVYCPGPGVIDRVVLNLAAGSTAQQALEASGILQRHDLPVQGLRLGVWCKPKEGSQVLRERDRVEVYRPLKVDPKEARRQRYQRHKDSQAKRAR